MAHETLGNIGSYISYDEDEGFIRKESQMQQAQMQQAQQMQMANPSGIVDTTTGWLSANWKWLALGAGAIAVVYFLWLRKPAGGAKRMYEFNPKKRK